jgi:hypothetical protein
MNTREIEQLIAKYYDGATSLEEEQALREFFASGSVPPHLAEHRPLFIFMEHERKQEMTDPDFERTLESGLQDGKVISMGPRTARWHYVAGIAAAAVLVIGIALTYLFNFREHSKYSEHDRLAYAQAQDAILMVSSGLNKGIDRIHYLGAFDKGMEKAQMLSRFYEYQTLIINPDGFTDQSSKTK